MSAHSYKTFLPRSSLPISRYPHPFVHDPIDFDYADGATIPPNNDKHHHLPSSCDIHPQSLWFSYSIKNTLDLRLLRLRRAITSKPNWHLKIDQTPILSRWRSECDLLQLPPAAFNYTIDELRHVRDYGLSVGYMRACADGVWQSDSLINNDIASRFLALMTQFEHDADASGKRDWHPGSDEKVWDLVHPSLFPYVHGLSKVVDAPITVRDCLVNINCGTVRDSPICSPDPADTDEAVDKTFCSEKFQWLPADVQVSADGRAVFESYINNLHPQEYAQLYQVLGQIFSKFVPMFEKVLTDLLFPIRRPTTVELDEPIFEDSDDDDDNNEDDSDDDDSDNSENLGSADENTGDGAEQAAGGTIHEPPRQLANLAERRDADDQTGDRLNIDASSPFDRTNSPEVQRRLGSDDRELKESIDLFLPFDGAGTERGKLAVSLRNRKLQVIVKLANIELTVDAPDYGGGTWHVEGTNNERIVATGIYYYDVHNITQSKLDFRQAVNSPSGYAQNDEIGARKVFGLGDKDMLSQPVGEVIARHGRCIAFPNVYQHRVSPFSLEKIQPDDASSCRAYRKILVFFLVDPTSSILSTANVPPQDRTWFTKQIVREAGEEGKSGQYDDEKLGLFTKNRSYFQLLDYNVLDQIMDKLKFPISASVAKHVREELMEERKLIVDSNNKELFEREFSLCEH